MPPNITLMPLPRRGPELKPVKNVRQLKRDNWLSIQIFKSYDDIVEHCCFAWNQLVEQPWRKRSVQIGPPLATISHLTITGTLDVPYELYTTLACRLTSTECITPTISGPLVPPLQDRLALSFGA